MKTFEQQLADARPKLSTIANRFFDKTEPFIADPEYNPFNLEITQFTNYCLRKASNAEISTIKPLLRSYLSRLRAKTAAHRNIFNEDRFTYLKYDYFYNEIIAILAKHTSYSFMGEATSATEEKIAHEEFDKVKKKLFRSEKYSNFETFFKTLFRIEYITLLNQNEEDAYIVMPDNFNNLFWELYHANLNDFNTLFTEIELRKFNKRKIACLEFLLQNPNLDINEPGIVNDDILTTLLKKHHYQLIKNIFKRSDLYITSSQNLLELAFNEGNGDLNVFKQLAYTPGIDINAVSNTSHPSGLCFLYYLSQPSGVPFFDILLDHPNININFRDNRRHSAIEYFLHKIPTYKNFIVKMIMCQELQIELNSIKDDKRFLSAYIYRKIYRSNISEINEAYLKKFLSDNKSDDNLELLQPVEEQTDPLDPPQAHEYMPYPSLDPNFFKTILANINMLLSAYAALDPGTREKIASVFIQIVFLCEGLVSVRPSATSKTKRFFDITQRLPLELQMTVSNRLFGQDGFNITGRESTAAAKKLATSFPR
jgi:hypothetical protein